MLIDLSGYSFSGKSALYDILDSMETIGGFGFESEFELLRVHGGLYELVQAISTIPWSPMRSDAAIRNFIKLSRNLGGSCSSLKDRIFRLGTYYDDLFPGYSKEVDLLLKELVVGHWKGYWPLNTFMANAWEIPFYKTLTKLGSRKSENIYLSKVESKHAYALCQAFMSTLISAASKKLNVKHLLVNNTFEPSASDAMYKLVSESFPIVVDRDPRDIYISAWLNSKKPDGVGSAIIGDDVRSFIRRFQIYRDSTIKNENVSYVQFEDMVTDSSYLFQKLSPLNLCYENFRLAWDKVAPNAAKNIGQWLEPVNKELYEDLELISKTLYNYCRN